MKIYFFTACFFSTFLASNTFGQNIDYIYQISLSELMQLKVSTVSRVDERKDLAPGNIYIIDRATIKARGYRSISG
jgi:hypothetical protein